MSAAGGSRGFDPLNFTDQLFKPLDTSLSSCDSAAVLRFRSDVVDAFRLYPERACAITLRLPNYLPSATDYLKEKCRKIVEDVFESEEYEDEDAMSKARSARDAFLKLFDERYPVRVKDSDIQALYTGALGIRPASVTDLRDRLENLKSRYAPLFSRENIQIDEGRLVSIMIDLLDEEVRRKLLKKHKRTSFDSIQSVYLVAFDIEQNTDRTTSAFELLEMRRLTREYEQKLNQQSNQIRSLVDKVKDLENRVKFDAGRGDKEGALRSLSRKQPQSQNEGADSSKGKEASTSQTQGDAQQGPRREGLRSSTRTCGYCNLAGHEEDSCWRKHPELRPKDGRQQQLFHTLVEEEGVSEVPGVGESWEEGLGIGSPITDPGSHFHRIDPHVVHAYPVETRAQARAGEAAPPANAGALAAQPPIHVPAQAPAQGPAVPQAPPAGGAQPLPEEQQQRVLNVFLNTRLNMTVRDFLQYNPNFAGVIHQWARELEVGAAAAQQAEALANLLHSPMGTGDQSKVLQFNMDIARSRHATLFGKAAGQPRCLMVLDTGSGQSYCSSKWVKQMETLGVPLQRVPLPVSTKVITGPDTCTEATHVVMNIAVEWTDREGKAVRFFMDAMEFPETTGYDLLIGVGVMKHLRLTLDLVEECAILPLGDDRHYFSLRLKEGGNVTFDPLAPTVIQTMYRLGMQDYSGLSASRAVLVEEVDGEEAIEYPIADPSEIPELLQGDEGVGEYLHNYSQRVSDVTGHKLELMQSMGRELITDQTPPLPQERVFQYTTCATVPVASSPDHTRYEQIRSVVADNVASDLISLEQVQELVDLVYEFEDCFQDNVEELKALKLPPWEATFKPSFRPIHVNPRPAAKVEQEAMRQLFGKLENGGIIVSKTGAVSHPVVMVKKPSYRSREGPIQPDDLRPTIDYSVCLNQHIEDENFPLPRPDEIQFGLAGKPFISTLDCTSGFFQRLLGKKTQAASGFVCPGDDTNGRVCLRDAKRPRQCGLKVSTPFFMI